MESYRRYNIQYIDDDTIVMAAGNTVKIVKINNINNTAKEDDLIIPGVAGSSIGAIAVCFFFLSLILFQFFNNFFIMCFIIIINY